MGRRYLLTMIGLLLVASVALSIVLIESIGSYRMRGTEAISIRGTRMTIQGVEFHPTHWPPFVYHVLWHVQAPRFPLDPVKANQAYEMHFHEGYCYVDEARFEE